MPQSEALREYLDELNPLAEVRALFETHGLVYRWVALFVMMLASIATILSSTIINVAIPDIMGAYGIGQDRAQWLATGNLAAATIGMLTSAWLVHTLGLGRTVFLSMLVFLVGCLLGGLSPNVDIMIVARVLQGIPTGVMTSVSMSIIFQLFPRRQQGFAMGIISTGIVLAPAVGPAIGGYLVDEFSWRFVYYMGIPFSILCLPGAALYLPGRGKGYAAKAMDWPGLILASVAITVLLVALSNGQREGWGSDYIVLCFFIAAVTSYCFVVWQQHTEHPLLDLRVFSFMSFSSAVALAFVVGAGVYGSTYIIPLFMQLIQGLNAKDAGIALIPAGVLMGVLAPFVGKLSDKIDHRILIASGIFVMGISFWLLSLADAQTAYWTYGAMIMLSRVGVSLVMSPLSLAALQSVPVQLVQQGSGAFSFLRQLGGAFGVNLVAVTLQIRTSFHMDGISAEQTVDNETVDTAIAQIMQLLQSAGLTATEQTYMAYRYLAQLNAHQANSLGFQDANLIVCVAFLLMLPLVLLVRNTD